MTNQPATVQLPQGWTLDDLERDLASIATEYPSAGYAWAYIQQQAATIERDQLVIERLQDQNNDLREHRDIQARLIEITKAQVASLRADMFAILGTARSAMSNVTVLRETDAGERREG
jgi:hypothetical protein